MLDNKKIYIIDKFGINSFWERSCSSKKLAVIDSVTRDIIDKINNDKTLIVFANYKEFEEFQLSTLYTECISASVLYIDDLPELMDIGFQKYFVFDNIYLMPEVKLLGNKESIILEDVILITSNDDKGKIKIVSLDSEITGRSLFLKSGELNIIVGEGSKLAFGKNCRIGKNINIYLEKNSCAVLGDNCSLHDDSSISLRSSSNVNIGDNCTFGKINIDAFCEINIGNNCIVGNDVFLRDGDGHDILGLRNPNYPKKIAIGNNVWLGARTTVLKGVEISDNCIIGSNSVVTKSFPSNSLIGGIPAAIIHRDVSWRPDYSFYREVRNVAPTHNWPFI